MLRNLRQGGIPPERILEIREDGRPLELDTISIGRFPIPAPDEPCEINELCRAAGVEPTGWMVFGAGADTR